MPFVDLDAEIERTSGLTVRALFESSGEAAFRERESLFLEATQSLPRAVVATGGGTLRSRGESPDDRRLGTAVFLDVRPSPLLSRGSPGKRTARSFTTPEAGRGALRREGAVL